MLRAGFHCVNFKVSRGNNPTALVAESHHPSAIVNASELIKSLDGLWRAHHERPIGTSTACAKASFPVPVRHEEGKAPVESEHRITPEIPSAQFARIRAWAKYGMTAAQVAGIYGVAIDVIERILRRG